MEAGKEWERWNDWLFRYQYLFRNRSSASQKRRFIQALAADLKLLDPDVRVEKCGTSKVPSYRVLVHDPAKADRIFITYYEGIREQVGDLDLFDLEDTRKKTMLYLLLEIVGWCIVAIVVVGAFFFLQERAWLREGWFVGFGLVFLLLFYWARTMRNGSSFASSSAQNTSSIIAMLGMIGNAPRSSAFVFVESAHGSIVGLRKSLKIRNDQSVYLLDRIGLQAPLHRIDHKGVQRVFAAEKIGDRFIVSKKIRHSNSVNKNNIEQVLRWFA
ncbi:hypothetical protein [Dubosiella newyorkensis]|uniref:hypothetical protein n=1 Tax=Dubosiella newyorkensis TaxID=1862672 RepID=UPI0025741A45|nr:hypothetical protein [Dubosiella newyorkensis]